MNTEPPPMFAQVAEEFVDSAWPGRDLLDQTREDARAEGLERVHERDRERKQLRRDILRAFRELEGIREKECECGCGRMFPVEYAPEGGRPQRFATLACRVRGWRDRVRERIVKIVE